jgi:hypothetical protein
LTFQARPQATSEVLVDDDKVRVTRCDFDPGAETRWHRHGMDYVVTTITPCAFLLEVELGVSIWRLASPIGATRVLSTMLSTLATSL